MGNKLFKFAADAPTTVNKVASQLMPLDKSQGPYFRIEKMWIQSPDLDAIAATDNITIQFSTLSQAEAAACYEIHSEYEIFTASFDFHLGEAALTSLVNPNVCMEVPGVEGTMLDCSEKNYFNHLQTGQDGAIDINVKILGQYVNRGADDWNYNNF